MPLFKRQSSQLSHSVRDYRDLVRKRLRKNPMNRTLALVNSIGSLTMEEFVSQGDGHVAVLEHYGLANGMSVYDLGCGCGRTAQALQRAGWTGSYIGADVVPELLDELERQCPGYETRMELSQKIAAPDGSLDLIYGWSVFTHLFPPETFLYLRDGLRALKPGGTFLFSFLEMEDRAHDRVWDNVIDHVERGARVEQLDQFLHRDWIRRFASEAGFEEVRFTDGADGSQHPPFWQSLAVLKKPAA
ncbi:MAG: class I SAM-dependent methyltransferase [Pseudomonadota bacterium]